VIYKIDVLKNGKKLKTEKITARGIREPTATLRTTLSNMASLI
jgi:hypothetical protein